MSITILKGQILHAPVFGELESIKDGFLVCENGKIEGLYQTLPERFSGAPVEDFGDNLITPSFADLHLHAPQYSMLGMGMDLPLLDWLQTYTFPAESRFADLDFAREAYKKLANALVSVGTTRVCMFSSLHREATHILMEELDRAGVSGYVGKVNMDRNCPDYLCEDTQQSISETLRWLEECEGRYKNIRPILTPRFVPSCTDELMKAIGKLAQEKNLPQQSHLSENPSEVEWVRELTGCEYYYEGYSRFGLFGEKTVMAHCVYSDERERAAMRDNGVWVAHCPDSNMNIVSGIAPVRQMLNEGVKVALGSDIAGGAHLNIMDVMTDAIRSSKARYMQTEGKDAFLTAAEAFYLATSAGAMFFGAGPGFKAGDLLHALVIDETNLPPSAAPLSPEQRLERILYLKGDIVARFSEGKKIGL
ncbi:amidohydrolase family protein [Eubacteriales bacterium OttesenSCG-928-K08]|nr:amidohydrolase family protein [Eubacteriales bacterium OttesenSCG-928-K08]